MGKYFLQHQEHVFQELSGGVRDEVQHCWPVLGEDVGDVLREVLADGPYHRDALVTLLPVALDEVVESSQQLFIEFWGLRQVLIIESGDVETVLSTLHNQFNLNYFNTLSLDLATLPA
jgi:hypothetical protein